MKSLAVIVFPSAKDSRQAMEAPGITSPKQGRFLCPASCQQCLFALPLPHSGSQWVSQRQERDLCHENCQGKTSCCYRLTSILHPAGIPGINPCWNTSNQVKWVIQCPDSLFYLHCFQLCICCHHHAVTQLPRLPKPPPWTKPTTMNHQKSRGREDMLFGSLLWSACKSAD